MSHSTDRNGAPTVPIEPQSTGRCVQPEDTSAPSARSPSNSTHISSFATLRRRVENSLSRKPFLLPHWWIVGESRFLKLKRHGETYAVLVGKTIDDPKYTFRVRRDETAMKPLFTPITLGEETDQLPDVVKLEKAAFRTKVREILEMANDTTRLAQLDQIVEDHWARGEDYLRMLRDTHPAVTNPQQEQTREETTQAQAQPLNGMERKSPSPIQTSAPVTQAGEAEKTDETGKANAEEEEEIENRNAPPPPPPLPLTPTSPFSESYDSPRDFESVCEDEDIDLPKDNNNSDHSNRHTEAEMPIITANESSPPVLAYKPEDTAPPTPPIVTTNAKATRVTSTESTITSPKAHISMPNPSEAPQREAQWREEVSALQTAVRVLREERDAAKKESQTQRSEGDALRGSVNRLVDELAQLRVCYEAVRSESAHAKSEAQLAEQREVHARFAAQTAEEMQQLRMEVTQLTEALTASQVQSGRLLHMLEQRDRQLVEGMLEKETARRKHGCVMRGNPSSRAQQLELDTEEEMEDDILVRQARRRRGSTSSGSTCAPKSHQTENPSQPALGQTHPTQTRRPHCPRDALGGFPHSSPSKSHHDATPTARRGNHRRHNSDNETETARMEWTSHGRRSRCSSPTSTTRECLGSLSRYDHPYNTPSARQMDTQGNNSTHSGEKITQVGNKKDSPTALHGSLRPMETSNPPRLLASLERYAQSCSAAQRSRCSNTRSSSRVPRRVSRSSWGHAPFAVTHDTNATLFHLHTPDRGVGMTAPLPTFTPKRNRSGSRTHSRGSQLWSVLGHKMEQLELQLLAQPPDV